MAHATDVDHMPDARFLQSMCRTGVVSQCLRCVGVHLMPDLDLPRTRDILSSILMISIPDMRLCKGPLPRRHQGRTASRVERHAGSQLLVRIGPTASADGFVHCTCIALSFATLEGMFRRCWCAATLRSCTFTKHHGICM